MTVSHLAGVLLHSGSDYFLTGREVILIVADNSIDQREIWS
jgi:hypothetical protein